MKLNGIGLVGYDDYPRFVLSCTLAEALALDGQTLAVTQDDGETQVAVFAGYSVAGVAYDADGNCVLTARRALDDATQEAIEGLDANVAILQAQAAALGAQVEQAGAKADEASQKADEAAQAASPSVKAASALYVNASTTLTNTQLGDVRDFIEDFVQGAEYEKGAIRRYDGKYYRMAQAIDSTTSQTYLPGEGTESLYTLIDLAPDGIRVWHAPTDATNSFALGEKAHYPDADGAVYVSQRDGNTSEPGTDEWWELADDEQ